MDTVKSLLCAIAERLTQRGRPTGAPAPWSAIARANLYVSNVYHVPLPKALADFWPVNDGLSFNGMLVYRPTEEPRERYLPNLREMNDSFAEVTGRRYLYIGEADINAFVHDIDDGRWHVVDRTSLDSFVRYDTCEALLIATLRKYLGAFGK